MLILVTNETGDTIFEKRTKINTIGPFQSKSYYLEPLEIEKGNLILPLNIDNRSDIKAEEVAPGPAPSPCSTLSPTGLSLIHI